MSFAEHVPSNVRKKKFNPIPVQHSNTRLISHSSHPIQHPIPKDDSDVDKQEKK